MKELKLNQGCGSLIDHDGASCVSIYLPTHRSVPEMRKDPIRLKNGIRAAEKELESLGTPAKEAAALLAPAKELLEDEDFWRYSSDGLAVFVGEGGFARYCRLARRVPEMTVVSNRFHVKPLLAAITESETFCVLALSQSHVRLIEVDSDGSRELDLGDAPRSLEEALRHDRDEKQLQFHTGADSGGGGRREAMYFGHGSGADDADQKERVRRFLTKLRGFVDDALTKSGGRPLVVAAVDYVAAIYRQVNEYPRLLDVVVSGNPDELDVDDLAEKARALVGPELRSLADWEGVRFRGMDDGSRTSNDLEFAIDAASTGRVDTAFVELGTHRWGTFDVDSRSISRHRTRRPGDGDLLDCVAHLTKRHGGTVLAVEGKEMPRAGSPVAVILRY